MTSTIIIIEEHQVSNVSKFGKLLKLLGIRWEETTYSGHMRRTFKRTINKTIQKFSSRHNNDEEICKRQFSISLQHLLILHLYKKCRKIELIEKMYF